MSRNEDKDCFVYVMAVRNNDGWASPVKVGIANNVGARLSSIKTACPYPIGVYVAFRLPTRSAASWLEKAFHRINKATRAHGEWFVMAPESAARSLCTGCAFMHLNVWKYPKELLSEWSQFVGVPFAFDTDGAPDGPHPHDQA